MGSGWIKIHRKITKHWVFKDSEYLKAWITILLNVAYEPGETLVKKTLLKYKKGESLKSIDTWGKMFGNWGKEKTRRFFNLLEKEQMISTKRTHTTTHLSVCNWDSYQEHCATDRISDEPLTVYQTSHTPATDKEVKERKEIKKEKNSIPPSLEMVKKYCEERNNGIDPYRFIDHYTSKGWVIGKSKMKDWQAAVRTWEKSNKKDEDDDFEPAWKHPL